MEYPDHRRLGRQLGIFASDDRCGSGLPLWLPAGATVRAEIERFVIELERRNGYQHVYTPQLAKRELYERSGHWEHFHDDMYPPMQIGAEQVVLRPMNCPHHILVFAAERRALRDLPFRIAELGTMFRYERSGDAAALDVHFLFRGNVTPAKSGYNVELLVVDGATERVLETKSVAVPAGAITPRGRDEIPEVAGTLTYRALQAEVERARNKAVGDLDVRDLSFRAYVDWGSKREQDAKAAYAAAMELLNRALALAPEDGLALWLTAAVNLCDCVEAWSQNIVEQQAIGAAALEKYLRKNPDSASALDLKSNLYGLQGRFEESLLIAESVLKREPDRTEARYMQTYDLLKLGRPQEALAAMNELPVELDAAVYVSLAAAIHYALAQYDLAAQKAQQATAKLNREELANRRWGAVALTLVAAEARLGRPARAKTALANFNAAVPGVTTIAAMKKWIHPMADLAGYEPLYEGLRLAGVSD